MGTILSFLVGSLFAIAVFLILQRSIVRLVMGLALISQAANLLIFTAGGIFHGKAPVISKTAKVLTPPYVDPLPQALILTAIVISFAVLSFSLVLIHRVHEETGLDDFDQMQEEG